MTASAVDDERRRLTTWSVIGRMGRRFGPYWWQVGGSLVLVVANVGLSAVAPFLLQRVIDDALPQRDGQALALLCGTMIAIGLLTSIVSVAGNALTDWIGQRVIARLRIDVYDRARAQSLEFYTGESEEQIQARLVSDIQGIDRFVTQSAQTALSALTTLAATAIVLAVMSWPLALLSFALTSVLSVFNNRFATRRRMLFRERQRLVGNLLRYAADDLSLGGIILGRTLRRTERQRERFAETCRRISELTFQQRTAGASAYTLIAATFACIPAAIYWLSGTVIPGLSVGTVVVLVILQTRLSGPIQSLLRLSGGLQASLAMFERILEYLDLETGDEPPEAVDTDHGRPIGVRLRNVSHHYAVAGRPALSGIDLDLPPGSVTFITGPTGSGKSTLGMVIAGMLPPTGGAVSVNGRPEPRSPRTAATMIPQHTTLFNASVRENLEFARDDLTREDIDRAVAAVRLDALVSTLPSGYDTSLGGGGHRLSGGERQRLGIARALLARCRMLVVDEATSSLDERTTHQITAALRAHCRDKTLVVITHRIPRLLPTDRVIAMDNGRIVNHDASLSHARSYPEEESK